MLDYELISERRIRRELQKFNHRNLSIFFDLRANVEMELHSLKGRRIDLRLSFLKRNSIVEIKELSEDINSYIHQFLPDKKIEINFELLIFNSYPFKPIQWKIKSKICQGFSKEEEKNILTFIEYKLYLHNRRGKDLIPRRKMNWSPVTTIQKDILLFYIKIDSIFDMINKLDGLN